jgi:hypothetical protein
MNEKLSAKEMRNRSALKSVAFAAAKAAHHEAVLKGADEALELAQAFNALSDSIRDAVDANIAFRIVFQEQTELPFTWEEVEDALNEE